MAFVVLNIQILVFFEEDNGIFPKRIVRKLLIPLLGPAIIEAAVSCSDIMSQGGRRRQTRENGK